MSAEGWCAPAEISYDLSEYDTALWEADERCRAMASEYGLPYVSLDEVTREPFVFVQDDRP